MAKVMTSTKKKSLTLTELLVVAAILTVVALVLIPNVAKWVTMYNIWTPF